MFNKKIFFSYRNKFNILLIFLISLGMTNFFKGDIFLSFKVLPNLGDNHVLFVVLLGIIFLVLNTDRISFSFLNFDKFFFIIVTYFLLVEFFQAKQNFWFIIDFCCVYFMLRFFLSIEKLNLDKKIVKIFNYIIISFSIFYVFLQITNNFGIQYSFINYGKQFTIENTFIFLIFFSSLLYTFHFRKITFFFINYFLIFFFLLFVYSRTGLIIFIFLTPFLFFSFKIQHKIKFLFVFIHIIILTVFLNSDIKESIESIQITSEERTILFDDNRTGEKNSTIVRLMNFERHLKIFKDKNYLVGVGYAEHTKTVFIGDLNHNDYGVCECVILQPLFIYGLVGFSGLVVLFFLIFQHIKISKLIKYNFLIISLCLFVIYGLLFAKIPIWFSYLIYNMKTHFSKNMKKEKFKNGKFIF